MTLKIWKIIMPWHLAKSRDLNYLSKRHASKLDSNLFDYLSEHHASKLDLNLPDYPSERYVSKLNSNLPDYPSERHTSKLDSKLVKCPSNTAQPSRLGSKRITTMFQSMFPYHPTLDQSNVLLTDQSSAKFAMIDCFWVWGKFLELAVISTRYLLAYLGLQ